MPDDDVLEGRGGLGTPVPKDARAEAVASAEEDSVGSPVESGLAAEADEAGHAMYEQRVRLAEDRLAQVLDAFKKLKSDNEGFRARTTKNLERRFEQRRERLLLKFIEILDNLDRALDAAETTYAGSALIEGLILVRTQLLQTLQEEGLERIPVIGQPYDPNVSEAVETRAVDDPDHHHVVVKELMRGYRLHGRIARASRVVVGEYHGERAPEPALPVPAPAEPEPPIPLEPVASAALASLAAAADAPDATQEVELPQIETLRLVEHKEPSLEEIIARAEAQEAASNDLLEEADQDDEDDL